MALKALIVHQEVNAGSASALPSVLALRAPQAAASSVSVSAVKSAAKAAALDPAGEQQLERLKQLRVGQYYSGAAASKELSAVKAVGSANRDVSFKNLDGGVSRLTLSSVTVSDSYARVKGTADVWASMAQRAPDGRWTVATPVNTLDVDLRMDRTSDGRWLVSSFTWAFAPGSEP